MGVIVATKLHDRTRLLLPADFEIKDFYVASALKADRSGTGPPSSHVPPGLATQGRLESHNHTITVPEKTQSPGDLAKCGQLESSMRGVCLEYMNTSWRQR